MLSRECVDTLELTVKPMKLLELALTLLKEL